MVGTCVCTIYLLTWIHDDEDTKQQHFLDKSMTFMIVDIHMDQLQIIVFISKIPQTLNTLQNLK